MYENGFDTFVAYFRFWRIGIHKRKESSETWILYISALTILEFYGCETIVTNFLVHKIFKPSTRGPELLSWCSVEINHSLCNRNTPEKHLTFTYLILMIVKIKEVGRCAVRSKVLQIKSCNELFLWSRSWDLGWFGPVGQFKVHEFHVTISSNI